MNNRDGLPNNDDWKTPKWLYDRLDAIFHFDFDPCPLRANFDGLKLDWGLSNFVNPPYNRIDKPRFIRKAHEQWKLGKTCVLLIPVATSTTIFHELILPYAQVKYFKGRIPFEGITTKGKPANGKKGKHDSMLVIYTANSLSLLEPVYNIDMTIPGLKSCTTNLQTSIF